MTDVQVSPPAKGDLDAAVPCPMCEYDLRGLTEPRCPECGHAFDWNELRTRVATQHPYLFEHHPRHNVWSFLRTLFGGLRPLKFWRTLRPIHFTRRRRIIAYWLVAAAIALVFLTGLTLVDVLHVHPGVYRIYLNFIGSRVEAFYRAMLAHAPVVQAAYLLAWPWVTLATFAIFTVSLGRAKIRADHMLRCVVYCGDAIVWVLPAMTLTLFLSPPLLNRYSIFDANYAWAVATLGLVWMSLRLLVAAKVYLNFRQSVRMTLLTQIIVLAPIAFFWAAEWVFYSTLRR